MKISFRRTLEKQLSINTLALSIFFLLGLTQLALWNFLAFPLFFQTIGFFALLALIFFYSQYQTNLYSEKISYKTLLSCFGISAILLLLGGEGRYFYANTDWQVRYAVLHDLTKYDWPFVYAYHNTHTILRAPLGMYLLPALAGKLTNLKSAENFLLLQNTVLFGIILSMASCLWKTTKQRIIALLIFLFFSGMDIIGQLRTFGSPWLHLEQWASIQYTAHITQLFWVPQHALAGWIFVVYFSLNREQKISSSFLYSITPILALLSPLALIGCFPYAIYAFLTDIRAKKIRLANGFLIITAVALSFPSFIYLFSGSQSVETKSQLVDWNTYITFITLEVGIYIIAIITFRQRLRFDFPVLLITIFTLALAPFGKIGDSFDFTMRASIPALAITALLTIDIFINKSPIQSKQLKLLQTSLISVFIIGTCTPVGEIFRAIAYPSSPFIVCNYYGVVPGGYKTYITAINLLPTIIRPDDPTVITTVNPTPCWSGSWPDSETGEESKISPAERLPTKQ